MYVNAFNRFTKEARRLEKRLCDVFANRSRGPRTEASRMNEKKKKKERNIGILKFIQRLFLYLLDIEWGIGDSCLAREIFPDLIFRESGWNFISD